MIPISSLNALEYCPRKFYYQFVQGETLVNEFVLEGTLAHRARSPGRNTHNGRRGDRDHAPVSRQRNTAPDGLCRCHRGDEQGCLFRWNTSMAAGPLAQRSSPALRTGAVPGRATTGQTASLPMATSTMSVRNGESRSHSRSSYEPGHEQPLLRHCRWQPLRLHRHRLRAN